MDGFLFGCLGVIVLLLVFAAGASVPLLLAVSYPVPGWTMFGGYLLLWVFLVRRWIRKAKERLDGPTPHPAISSEVWNRIQEELRRIEHEEQVTVLYACESGSRAWGFESDDSDYDVRFIYLRKTSWYLTIQNKRDVIERPISDELDIAGWDLPKALGLFRKSNPPLLEWLQSPIVYLEASSCRRKLMDLLPGWFSPISCLYHYLHMAQNNFKKYLQDRTEVSLKKYLYVLRPVLACIWIERGFGAVPMEFQVLIDRIVADPVLLNEVNKLLTAKKAGGEMGRGPRNEIISKFLESELARLAEAHPPVTDTRDAQPLDSLFHALLVEVNGSRLPGAE
jgi:uncharacterized protein